MKMAPEDVMVLLRNAPATIRSLVNGLPDAWHHANYGPDTFSPFDVLGHLVHGEREDWLTRAKIILEHGEDRPFDSFDRYAMYEQNRGRTMAGLLDDFEALRGTNLEELAAMDLSPTQLELRGTHPELGGVNLSELLAAWVIHDLHHIAQICKAMSYQYRDEVGVWGKYLGIIPRA